MLTSIILQKQGFEVIQSNSGRKAILALEENQVDLILMDVDMPDMNGLEATATIRNSQREFSHVPIIAHTGDISADAVNNIRLSGMHDHLRKPASQDALLEKISDWI